MKSSFFAALMLAAIAVPSLAQAELIYALTNNDPTIGQQLVTFDSNTRAVTSSVILQTASTLAPLASIDVRPATGQLYGFDASAQQLYRITPSTGALTAVGAPLPSTTHGTLIDFNPTVDRIRLLSYDNQNFRLNPNDGSIAATDTALAFAAADTNAGDTPNIRGSAYTNSVAGATTTSLYDIDITNSILALQNPPNNGTLNTIGGLGFTAGNGPFGAGGGFNGFDISGATGVAYLTDGAFAGPTNFYTVNLATGAATNLGTISGLPTNGNSFSRTIADIAVTPEPTSLAVVAGMSLLGLRRRRA